MQDIKALCDNLELFLGDQSYSQAFKMLGDNVE